VVAGAVVTLCALPFMDRIREWLQTSALAVKRATVRGFSEQPPPERPPDSRLLELE